MGTLVVTEFMTLDGVAQAPGAREEDQEQGFPHGGWQGPLSDDASGEAMFAMASGMDALLLGRRTYDIFAGYWPTADPDIPFTELLNRVPKYVPSHTLTEPLSWEGSHLLAGDLAAAVTELKDRHAEIHVIGSLDLLQSLLREGLVDRLNLWQYPLVLGTGKRVFEAGAVPTTMRLTQSATYPTGTVQLTYEPVGPPTYQNMDEARG